MITPLSLLTDPAADASTWGGKGAALVRLVQAGFPVPPFVALRPEAFHESLTPAQAEALAAVAAGALDPETLAESLAAVELSEAVRQSVAEALHRLGDPSHVAVRSSAPDEDGAAHAFAGQFESFLFVLPDRVAERVGDVWRSAFAPRVWAYREAHGLAGPPLAPAVVLQVMVEPEAAGVAFSVDPVSGADVAVVAAVRGLGSALVDGRADAETVRVTPHGTVESRQSPEPGVADRFDRERGEGVREVAEDSSGPVLTDRQAVEVAALARRAAEHLGGPQDVEWAWADGRLWILQSRPITTLATPEAEGRIRLWDNANIVESYGGITTPLTFSFARRAYEAVYREFCRILRVPEARVEAESETFEQMIGLVRGRVYYNLGSWYRILALLPGYRLNAPLMEGMMGVTEGIPDDLRPAPPTTGRVRDALDLLAMVVGLVAAHRRLPRMKAAFLDRVDRALATDTADLSGFSLDGLAGTYADLERQLLRAWDAPLVNDFFAMIWFGLANRAADAWIGPGALGGLLTGDGAVVSAEPARRVRALALQARHDADWTDTLAHGRPEAIAAGLKERPAFADAVADHLARFGDRCLEELKLESPTLVDDPMPFYRAVGAYSLRLRSGNASDPQETEARLRSDAERRAADALSGHPVRRLTFSVLLRHARARVRDRENLRFERTRVFGRARRLVIEMGRRLVKAGRLDSERQVFNLTVDELLGAARGTGVSADLRAVAEARRAEFEQYAAEPPPPDRFTTRGAVATSPLIPAASGTNATDEHDVRDGLGCCAGVVEGPVRVVTDPRGVDLAPGTILVAERTDPGWILLFPACAGLVVERGSLLSHSAIVARELGIPAAVSVPGATAWLRDGDRVRLDGATGRVEKIDG